MGGRYRAAESGEPAARHCPVREHHDSAERMVFLVVDGEVGAEPGPNACSNAGTDVFHGPVESVSIGDGQERVALGGSLVNEGLRQAHAVMGGIGAGDVEVREAHPQSRASTQDPSASRRRS